MRCYCCNKNLSDYESRLRSVVSNEFLDMCKKCLNESEILFTAPTNVEEDSVDDDEYFVEIDEVYLNGD